MFVSAAKVGLSFGGLLSEDQEEGHCSCDELLPRVAVCSKWEATC